MIRELLTNKTATEKAEIKGREIAKLDHIGRFVHGELEVEITNLKAFDGGVEVLARAWQGGKQLGFGKDGTVDIERFRIFNPPVLIDDPNGTIEKIMTDGKEVFGTRWLKEDPIEAIRQSLVHTINLVGKRGTSVVRGKIGNTTSTFYPNAGTTTAPVDGAVRRSITSETFSTIRNSTGNEVGMTATVGTNGQIEASTTTDQFRRMDRMLYGFDIDIGTDAVDSATFSLFGTGSSNGLGGVTVIELTTVTPTNNDTVTTFVNGDYEVAKYGSDRLATGIAISSWSGVAYNDFTLNATGEAYITNGIRYIATRSNFDVDNSFSGGTWLSGQEARGLASTADHTGTTQDPKLVVEHSEPLAAVTFSPNLLTLGVG